MGHLRIYFVGLCTHLWERTSRETEHRIVLVNGSNGESINDERVGAHHASLVLSEGNRLSLNGVKFSIVNAADPAVNYDHSFYSCIPRLTTFAPNLGPLSAEMVRDSKPALAAAYFDAAGTFFAIVEQGGASSARLEVVTTGTPILRKTDFVSGKVEDLELPDDAAIQFENLGEDDNDADFLLNFKIARAIPSDARWPTTAMSCAVGKVAYRHVTVGPGCSNSLYP